MSYILEALRKADAERQRGTVPGLNTPAAPPLPAREHASPRNGRRLGIAAALLAALALLAWQFGPGKNAATDTVTLAQAPMVPTAPILPTPAMPARAAAPAVAPAAPPAPTTATRPVPAPAAKAVPAPAAVKPPALPSPATPVPARPPASAAAGAPAKVAPASAPEARIPTQGELPEDVRARLPRLAISGASYSENPAHRMLIVGGQIYREGEEPAPGLTLEKIAPKEAILNYQGIRYRLGYP